MSGIDWTEPRWSNPLVHVASNGSFVDDRHDDGPADQ